MEEKTSTTSAQEQAIPPTIEEIRAYYKETIEVARYRTELAELNALSLEAEIRRVEAAIKLANLKAPSNASQEDREEVQG